MRMSLLGRSIWLRGSATIVMLTAAAVAYRNLFAKYKLCLKKVIGTSAFYILPVAIIVFIYSSFLTPVLNLKGLQLLYSIRTAAPGEPLSKPEIDLFKGLPQTSNVFQLADSIESLITKEKKLKKRLIKFSQAIDDTERKRKYLNDSLLSVLGIKYEELTRKRWARENNHNMATLDIGISDIFWNRQNMNKYRQALINNFHIPVFTLITFYIGLCLGALSRRNHILLVILGINWGLGVLVYYGEVYTRAYRTSLNIGVYFVTIFALLFPLLILLLLYRIAKTSLKNWSSRPVLIPHKRSHYE